MWVVSYRNSTSNHNVRRPRSWTGTLYLIEILHQTTTSSDRRSTSTCCILSKFYIKPQPSPGLLTNRNVVSYRNSTSNHNSHVRISYLRSVVSYRNSTSNHNHIDTVRVDYMLYLIEILHQTTTPPSCLRTLWRCILSKFYIKPQRGWTGVNHFNVVSYRNSTSNHNENSPYLCSGKVVSYRNSTSNHNQHQRVDLDLGVVSYRNSTSNHNKEYLAKRAVTLYLIEILHQTTTRLKDGQFDPLLYLIEILHQTTTFTLLGALGVSLYLIEILHQTTTDAEYPTWK